MALSSTLKPDSYLLLVKNRYEPNAELNTEAAGLAIKYKSQPPSTDNLEIMITNSASIGKICLVNGHKLASPLFLVSCLFALFKTLGC